ncbi:MAG: hypothetical protein WC455_27480 [Dehalococcoidia bacterium]|jgi:hypothetical protein
MIKTLTIVGDLNEKTGELTFQVNGDLPFSEAARILVMAASAHKKE